jgi:chromatin remodeling complex protein RSC6
MASQEEPKDKIIEKDKQQEKESSITPPKKSFEQKKEEEIRRNQIDENNKRFDTKLMKYFGNEFFERRLEIPPKRSIFDPHEIDEEFDKIIPKNKILRNLIHFEKKMDEKIYKTRLDIQEQLLRPKNMIKAKLRTHIFAVSKDDENSDETNFILNIEGKIIDKSDKKFRKFSHYFRKIQIKFDEEIYPDIEWENPAYLQMNQMGNNSGVNNMNSGLGINNNQSGQSDMGVNSTNNMLNNNNSSSNNNINNNNVNIKKENETDVDGFSIKRPAKEENMKIKILFYLSYHIQEFILNDKLSELLGITRGTRPQILYHLWQYIKLNSLQDN